MAIPVPNLGDPVKNQSGATVGTAQFDPNTGQPLQPSSTSPQTPQSPNALPVTTSGNPIDVGSPEFTGLMQQINNNLSLNNNLTVEKQILLKHLYDTNLTPDELNKLSPSSKALVMGTNRDAVELQVRVLNDQIQGRANTLGQTIQALTTGYEQAQTNTKNAVNEFLLYSQSTGKSIQEVARALAPIYGIPLTNQVMENLRDLGYAQKPASVDVTSGNSTVNIPLGTLAATNNNPGNLRLTTNLSSDYGATQGAGGFAKFSDPQVGWQAMVDDVQAKISGLSSNTVPDGPNAGQALTPQSTLEDLIRVYAPTSDNNNPASYAATVASKLGVSTDTPIGNLSATDVASAMAGVESGAQITPATNDIQAIAQAIESGIQPPDMSKFYGKSSQLRAQLARDHFDLTKATIDWTATQKWIATANNSQQLRLKQAITSVQQGVTQLKTLADQWNAGGFAPLNALNMKVALNGVYGQQAQDIAAKFEQQSTIITDELGQTFMGGNSPTDKSLSLAGEVFNTSWSDKTLNDALDNLDKNLTFRSNAIATTGPTGVGGTNQYDPTKTDTSTTTSDTTQTSTGGSTYNGITLPN